LDDEGEVASHYGWRHAIFFDRDTQTFVVPNVGIEKVTLTFEELPEKGVTHVYEDAEIQYHVDRRGNPVRYNPKFQIRE
jgi:hypothetical protein